MAAPESKDHTAVEELQFQKFTDEGETKDGEDVHFTRFPILSPDDFEEEADLLSDRKKGPPSFWTWEYYQSLFDVDTNQVLQRIMWSMIPNSGYMQRCIKSRPDLYGPFWICATLVFTIAISGNIADYLRSEGKRKDIWRYDFHKVSFAATAIYTYAWFVPLMIWGLLWYRGSRTSYSLMQIMCVYGYSLSIYIPVSILWLIDINWLQWSLVLVGSVLSGIVLLLTFWPTVKNDDKKKTGYFVLLAIFILHIVLAIGFMTYFFHGPTHKSDFNNIAVPTSMNEPIQPITASLPNIKGTHSDSHVNRSESADQNYKTPNVFKKDVKSKITDSKLKTLNDQALRKIKPDKDPSSAAAAVKIEAPSDHKMKNSVTEVKNNTVAASTTEDIVLGDANKTDDKTNKSLM